MMLFGCNFISAFFQSFKDMLPQNIQSFYKTPPEFPFLLKLSFKGN